ncbi:MAG: rRNA maturation RNase YbeY [Lentisphaeria bacterium]|nr:rRNA maturation RNase YbeY [Lentisphaeria bacterium]
MIQLHCRWMNRQLPPPKKSELRRLAHAAAVAAGLPVVPEWDLNLLFVNDRAMAKYNADLVGHEGTTDVITFSYFDDCEEYEEQETMIELIINPDAALREGAKREGGYAREMVLYLVHGLLHSAGEDDLSPVPRRRMRRRERECLAELEKVFEFDKIFKEA